MPEPIDPALPCPRYGWPHAVIVVELLAPPSAEEAYRTLAECSRRWRAGVKASLNGEEVYAWPHQSVDEIARTHLRTRTLQRAST